MLNFSAAAVQDMFDKAQSYIQQLGLFETVATHEPKNPPGQGLWAAVWVRRIAPIPQLSGLNAVSARVELTARVGSNAFRQPYDGIDPEVTTATLGVMAAFAGSFSLGGTVFEVDLLGAYGGPLAAEAGYVTIGQTVYRFMDVAVPVIIDNAWTEVA